MAVAKKKIIKSIEGLDETLKDLVKKQYPTGYQSNVTRIINAKKEHIFVFPIETDDAIYLIKVPSTKNSDGAYEIDFGKKGEFDKPDDVDEFGVSNTGDDLETSDSDFDGDEGDGASKEPGYEPDFDN